MAEKMGKLEEGESIETHKDKDPNTSQDLIVITWKRKQVDCEITVDPETKLPLRINVLRSENMGQWLKSAKQIYYNEPIPPELVNFKIPDGVKVFNAGKEIALISDPNFGISAAGLTKEEAFIKICKEHWQAVIDKNSDIVKKLYPALLEANDTKLASMYGGENPIVELVKIGQSHPQRGLGIGLITPCTVKSADGKMHEIQMITVFKNSNDYSWVVLFGTWGKSRTVE